MNIKMQRIYTFYLAYYTCINAIMILTYIILWRIILIPNIALAEEQVINNNNKKIYALFGAVGITIIGVGLYYFFDYTDVTLITDTLKNAMTVSISGALVLLPQNTSLISIDFVKEALTHINSVIISNYADIVSYGHIENPRTRMILCHMALFHD